MFFICSLELRHDPAIFTQRTASQEVCHTESTKCSLYLQEVLFSAYFEITKKEKETIQTLVSSCLSQWQLPLTALQNYINHWCMSLSVSVLLMCYIWMHFIFRWHFSLKSNPHSIQRWSHLVLVVYGNTN